MNGDQLLRRGLALFGIVSLIGSLGLILAPSLSNALPFGGGTIGGLGVILLLLGLFMARVRLSSGVIDASTPSPEYPPPVEVPGNEFDRIIYDLLHHRHGAIEYRDRIYDRLYNATVEVIVYREDCSQSQAEQMIEEGSWTDNPHASGFFTGDLPSNPSLTERIFGGAGEDFEEGIRQTVNAIGRYAEIETQDYESLESEEKGIIHRISSSNGEPDSSHSTNWNPDWVRQYGESPPGDVIDLDTHQTNHWVGVSVFGLVAAGLGVFASQPALLVTGAIGVSYAAYTRGATEPPIENLQVTREVSDESPDPNDEIDVHVTIKNEGSSTLFDLRLIDIIPDMMSVVDGSPRLATALRPGSTASITYTTRARRGKHTWPLYITARESSGSVEREAFVTPDTTVTCMPSLKTVNEMPVRAQTSQYSGEVATTSGGPGIEFHSVRDYRVGDPMNRVNWKRLAKTGELSTVNFREEQAATITLLFDTRQVSYVAPSTGSEHAVDRAIWAASDIFPALYEEGNLVGMAAFDTVPCWLAPGAGSDQLERAKRLFMTHPALSSIPPDRIEHETGYVDPMTHIRRQLPSSSQIMLFTPLCDNFSSEIARRLNSANHLVTVISPDPTSDESIGQRLARVERIMRLNNLRERGVRVIDWKPDEQLTLELQRAEMRWSA